MKNKSKCIILWALAELLFLGLLLLSFAWFHHGRAWVEAQLETAREQAAAEELPALQLTASPVTEETPAPAAPVGEEEEEKTPWQLRFAGHFSDEVILTESAYKSPELSIELSHHEGVNRSGSYSYYAADIYIARPENFRTAIAHDRVDTFSSEKVLDMVQRSGALLAMNGDFYSYHKNGVILRNGEIIMNDYSYNDICILYKDGRVEVLAAGSYQAAELPMEEIWQIWDFGPSLLDENGKVKEHFNSANSFCYTTHPRSALGYFEPGHYCFIVAEGRVDNIPGMRLDDMAKIFEDLGCTLAYNLDGGGSSTLVFDGRNINRLSNAGRGASDILLIAEVPGGGMRP